MSSLRMTAVRCRSAVFTPTPRTLRDLLRRLALGDKLHDFALALAEPIGHGFRPLADTRIDDDRGDGGTEVRHPARDLEDRLDEVRPCLGLEHVPAHARPERGQDIGVLPVHREGDDLGRRRRARASAAPRRRRSA